MTAIPDERHEMSGLQTTLRIAGGALLALFSTGVLVGIGIAVAEKGHFKPLVALPIAVALGLIWLSWRMIRPAIGSFALRRSPRMRQSQILLYASVLLGMVVGGGLYLVDGTSSVSALLSGSPVAPAAAISLILAWLLCMVLSLKWHLTLDEHEKAAYDFGFIAGLYLYAVLMPAWWLAWRGGMLPEPDAMAVFWIVGLFSTVAWLWRRTR